MEAGRAAPPGRDRLLAICRAWTAYVQNPSFPGGCFIAAASFEYDSRDGNVHDALRKVVRRWRRTLVAEIETAVEAGELPADSDPDQIAFTLESLAAGTSPSPTFRETMMWPPVACELCTSRSA